MPPAPITPESLSGTSTPTDTSASALTNAGIKHATQPARTTSNGTKPSPLDASRLTVNLTATPRTVPEPNSPEVHSLRVCTDHMITARWTAQSGWEAPSLHAYGPLELMPTASALQYATECFEGLKLYRGYDGRLRLFRLERNCARMKRSMARIALPDLDPVEFGKLVLTLCGRDGPKWLPKERAGEFLYLRPTCIATDPALGVQRPSEALLYVIIACFPCSTAGGPAPTLGGGGGDGAKGQVEPGMKLIASEADTVRAWPGGFGYAKVGANYGPTLVAQGEARSRGFTQVLWLFGQEGYVTEAGASNFFVVWRNKTTQRLELVTAPLEGRMILEGVTRDSVLQLAKRRLESPAAAYGVEPIEIVERRFTMDELIEVHQDGRLVEAFAAGTAVFIAPVSLIHFRGMDIDVPMDDDSGVYARVIKKMLMDIMYGVENHEWGVVVDEVEA